MEQEKFLTEEKYQKTNKLIKTVGLVVLIVGIIMAVMGLIALFMSLSGFGKDISSGMNMYETGVFDNSKMAKNTFGDFSLFIAFCFLDFSGASLIGIGIILLIVAHRREIKSYLTQQSMPVVQEGIEKITPTVSDAAGSIAQSISKGIEDGKKDSQNNGQ